MGGFQMLFLGYDPGGRKKNGVAAVRLISEAVEVVATAAVLDAADALVWLAGHSNGAQALGIDTLLAWSRKGGRACDDVLRRKYGGSSVVAQNSLYSAMTINGAIVARRLGLPVYESHPKLLLQTGAAQVLRPAYEEAIAKAGADHEGDAIVAAWCAAMGHTRKWTVDLYTDVEDDIERVVPSARYPWFEAV
jgi:predicted nuclease with RNAse H fold